MGGTLRSMPWVCPARWLLALPDVSVSGRGGAGEDAHSSPVIWGPRAGRVRALSLTVNRQEMVTERYLRVHGGCSLSLSPSLSWVHLKECGWR